MELFKIVTDKEELKKRCLEVETPISEELKTLLLKMIDYLKKSQDDDFAKEHDVRPGVGLAANQIGYNQRFLAIYLIDDHGKEIKYGLVNPVITSYSVQESYISNGEGCLSVKEDVPGYVYRHAKITVRAYDVIEDKIITIKAKGFLSIVLQHEIDHLNGLLYTDRINKDNPFIEKEGALVL
jgi:peptide deformylase